MVKNIEDKYLSPFKIIQLWASAIEQVRDEIITNIIYEKQKWLDKRVADCTMEIITSYKWQSDWKKK